MAARKSLPAQPAGFFTMPVPVTPDTPGAAERARAMVGEPLASLNSVNKPMFGLPMGDDALAVRAELSGRAAKPAQAAELPMAKLQAVAPDQVVATAVRMVPNLRRLAALHPGHGFACDYIYAAAVIEGLLARLDMPPDAKVKPA